jgi:hypothetical protein
MPNTTPPATIAPIREAPLFAATVKLTLPLPEPDGGDREIQATFVVAVHAHPR